MKHQSRIKSSTWEEENHQQLYRNSKAREFDIESSDDSIFYAFRRVLRRKRAPDGKFRFTRDVSYGEMKNQRGGSPEAKATVWLACARTPNASSLGARQRQVGRKPVYMCVASVCPCACVRFVYVRVCVCVTERGGGGGRPAGRSVEGGPPPGFPTASAALKPPTRGHCRRGRGTIRSGCLAARAAPLCRTCR